MNKKKPAGTIIFGALIMFISGLYVVSAIKNLLPLAQYIRTQHIVDMFSKNTLFAGISKPEIMTMAKEFVGQANKLETAITVYFALMFISGMLIIFRKNIGRLSYLFLLLIGLFLDLTWLIRIWLIPNKESNVALINLVAIFIVLIFLALFSFYYFTRPTVKEQFR